METLIKLAIATPLALGIYYILPRRGQNIWLLLISYLFYSTWSWQFALILAGLTLANYAVARRIVRVTVPDRRWLIAGITLNVAALVLFKYADFFLAELTRFNLGTSLVALKIILPIGLSFLILQTISYLVDVYQGILQPHESLLDFALYLAYFPKLISGPIERARTFLPQLATDRPITHETRTRGLALILMGALRKIIIADTLYALIPKTAFENPAAFPAPILWSSLLAFAFALYNDFAGYSNIARGISDLFGIQLSSNFEFPYFAQSFGEFWSSWHITFSNWLRDYIYFPVARFLRGKVRDPRHPLNVVIPPMLTMLVSGMWHAITIPMLLWGALHGIYQVGERILLFRAPRKPGQHSQQPLWRQILSALTVFVLVILAWVPFHTTLPATLQFWQGLFSLTQWALPDVRIFVVLILALMLDGLLSYQHEEAAVLRWPSMARIALIVFVCVSVYLILEGGVGITRPFVYQGF